MVASNKELGILRGADQPCNVARRSVLKTAVGCLSGPVAFSVFGALAGCESTPSPGSNKGVGTTEPVTRRPGYEPKMLSISQALTLEDLTEQIIPETDTPGAKQAGVPEFVESIVRDLYSVADGAEFLAGLDAVNARAQMLHSQPFYSCGPTVRAELFGEMLKAVQASKQAKVQTPFFDRLRKLTIQGFCQSKLGATRVLQYESVPGAYKACVPLESVGRAWATQ